MKITNIPVVLFEDIPDAQFWNQECGGFSRVSYGDAEYTLILPGEAIDEIKYSLDDLPLHDHIRLVHLIEKIMQIPEGTYLALKG